MAIFNRRMECPQLCFQSDFYCQEKKICLDICYNDSSTFIRESSKMIKLK